MKQERGMRSWLAYGLLLLACGCGRGTFLLEPDSKHFSHPASKGIDPDPDATPLATLERPCKAEPPAEQPPSASIRTVMTPEAQERHISLAECFALALENGRLGTTAVRVLTYESAIAGVDVEQALARFDARWSSAMSWASTDQPIGTAETNNLGGTTSISKSNATLRSGIDKPLPTGGLAGITFTTDYEISNLNARVNPAYTPVLTFSMEQPLLQGAGVRINQLSSGHPVTGGGGAGILLARVALDQSQVDFELRVQELLVAVESAYWSLYGAYGILYSRDTALKQIHFAWQISKERFDARLLKLGEMAQITQQYHAFRAERMDALGNGTSQPGVLESERMLRFIIGLPPEDGYRLVPSDRPVETPYLPDWQMALATALEQRPELARAANDVKSASLALEREKNLLLPDVRAFGSYNINGLGNRLDGGGGGNALRNLAQNDYNDWAFGLRATLPIGFRDAHGRVRRTELQLAQRRLALKSLREEVAFGLQRSHRSVVQAYERIRIIRARRLAAAQQLSSLFDEFILGQVVVDFLVTAERNYVDSLRDEQLSIVSYNIALCEYERQKGTILAHDNISIAEGPLPVGLVRRASERLRERQQAITLSTRPDSSFVTEAPICTPSLPHPVMEGTQWDLPPHIESLGERMRETLAKAREGIQSLPIFTEPPARYSDWKKTIDCLPSQK